MVERIRPEVERPLKIYKYRNWKDTNHQKVLKNFELYFSNPADFNDPFDGQIPMKWGEMTYQDCFDANYKLFNSLRGSIKISEDKFRKFVKEQTDSKKFYHPETVKNEDVESWNNRIGLCSFSAIPNNDLMWSHYADAHRGFCLGFDTTILLTPLLFDYLEPIDYVDQFPKANWSQDSTTRFYKRFFTKSRKWEYEQEWRISKNHIEDRVKPFNPIALKEIILGYKIDQKSKDEILDVARFISWAEVFEVKLDEQTYSTKIEKLVI